MSVSYIVAVHNQLPGVMYNGKFLMVQNFVELPPEEILMVLISLVPRPSRLHTIILRAIIWVVFEKREGLVDLVM